MSYQERKSLFNILTSLIIASVYFLIIWSKYNNGDFDTSNMLRFWAVVTLIYIPISIAARIIAMILYRIGGEIKDEIKGEKEDRDVEDERDKLIELKSDRFSQYTFGLGFIISLVSILMGGTISTFFIIILCSGFLGEVISNLMQIYYYKRGL